MLVNADIYVKDIPGSLVRSLEPVSAVDGNIVGVVHNREQVIDGMISVNLTFNVESDKLETLKSIWKSRDVVIAKMGSVTGTVPMDYILIGNADCAFTENLMKKAAETVAFSSYEINTSSQTDGEGRTVRISAKLETKEDAKKLDAFMVDSCEKNKLTCIRGLTA
ncbi:MAG: homoserine dehydrogenase [Candidatus Methanomethylophilaceae archaeon]|jgi:ACT domain-containing protein|nr:hypothetical protein AOA81_04430 [Methanomassiliicoccales archaeon RumEn M2]MDD2532313.1 homoserine dehydrogenase [Candidatus Methanomethylophilaceae archaeon]MDI9378400.1 homoserine dehydrogenase [Candidatus Thermoplasmatota archaeon]MDD2778883.1 homoserine dehydrogenase [Candidatus Methanomethylophilaceae archaeon]MDD3128127.1 homoserine dehydrogenase [Candidatus Methanomethylophilaceae archaeon]